MSTILVIDDKKDNLVTMKALLKNLIPGCVILTAQSGEEGLALTLAEKPDTIILDVKMPGMDGYQVCKALKSDPETGNIPVIFLTAIKTDTASKVEGLKIGADAFLTKPVDPAELEAQINAMLRIKHAEDILRKEKNMLQNRYQSLFHSISDAVFIHDDDGIILEVNSSASDILGYPGDTLVGMHLGSLTGESQFKSLRSYFNSVNSRWSGTCEISFLTADNDTVTFELMSTPITYMNASAILSVARDITERKSIDEIRTRLTALLDNSDDAIIGTTTDGIVAGWNRSAARIFGYPEEEIKGCSIGVLSPPYQPDEFPTLVTRVADGETIEHYESVGMRNNGSTVHMQLTLAPITDSTDQVIGCSIIARDLTEQKETRAKLKRDRNLIRTLEEASPAFFMAIDARGDVLMMNRAMLSATGYSQEQMADANFLQTLTPPQEHDMLMDHFRKMVRSTTTQVFESTVITSGGRELFVEWHAKPIFDEDDKLDFYIVVGLDITERRQLEKMVMKANEQERSRIAQDLHDGLGQHLAGITFKSEILKLKLKEKNLNEVRDVDQIISLVHQALEHTRMLARGLSPIDIEQGGLFQSVKKLCDRVQADYGISCILQWDNAAELDDSIETTHLYYIIRESMNNAIKHAHPKNIVITLADDGDYILLKVADDGSGIPEQVDMSAGMGMNIMQYRAWIIGAALQVQPNPGGGTLVTCNIRKSPDVDVARTYHDKSPAPGQPSADNSRILIVDDHPIVRQGLAEIIERTDGLDVHGEVGSVNEAIDFIARDQPQLVLVDVSLDGSSGLDLVKALKTRYPGLHTLMLSMFDEKLYGERAIRAGARGYVMKQEPPEKIIKAIRTVLDGGIYLSDSIKENILNSLATEPSDGGFSDIDSLTDREFEIFQLIGHGLGNRHIAEKLHVSIKTVENMREKIKTKLHMESSADLLQYAVQWMIEKG